MSLVCTCGHPISQHAIRGHYDGACAVWGCRCWAFQDVPPPQAVVGTREQAEAECAVANAHKDSLIADRAREWLQKEAVEQLIKRGGQ